MTLNLSETMENIIISFEVAGITRYNYKKGADRMDGRSYASIDR